MNVNDVIECETNVQCFLALNTVGSIHVIHNLIEQMIKLTLKALVSRQMISLTPSKRNLRAVSVI